MSRDFKSAYTAHVSRLEARLARNDALQQAVGANFLAVGRLELSLLRSLGLQGEEYVVDVGCGSGRLAAQLSALPGIDYTGTDVVAGLLGYARELCARPDWRFEETGGTEIPEGDGKADFVCFFSVFTHLQHEDTYRYLAEAKRVLKPTGRIVFSFLEFRIYSHWEVFRASLEQRDGHLNQFLDRDAIHAFAHHLGLRVDGLYDGDKPHIPIAEEIRWDDGRIQSEMGSLGQSVAVLSKASI